MVARCLARRDTAINGMPRFGQGGVQGLTNKAGRSGEENTHGGAFSKNRDNSQHVSSNLSHRLHSGLFWEFSLSLQERAYADYRPSYCKGLVEDG